ncbi:MAG: hypothetical protein ACFFEE_13085, partial [Candidatus Thorarchaeota archaeon]
YPEIVLEDDKLVETDKMLNLPINNVAIEHTVSKIDENLIIDPILKEEFVQDCRLTMAVDRENNFTAMQKGGGAGPISLEHIEKAMEMALESAESIRKKIDEAVKAVE